jgi:hypothetical protein
LLHKHKKEASADSGKERPKLNSIVFKKDYVGHIDNPLELLDQREAAGSGRRHKHPRLRRRGSRRWWRPVWMS